MTAPPTTPAIAANSTGQSLAPVNGYAAAKLAAIMMIRRECDEATEHDSSWSDFRLAVEERLEREQALLMPLRKPHTGPDQTPRP